MPYHIDEENSELVFEVREGNKLVIKIKSNIFSDSLELYLIKVGDNTEPTDKNVFSSLRVLKEIENLHDTILKEINSVTSGFWELKQDSQGNEYIATKYNVLTEGGLTTYGLGEQKLGTIYDGLPIDNDTIYWEEVEGSRVLKAKGSGGGSTGLDETKLWNVLGTPGNQQIDYSHLSDAFSQFNNDFVTIGTEQTITALKHFTAGLSIGSSKKKIYEKEGVLYIDSSVAITGALTMYATDGQSVSSIYDGLPIDNDTIYWETVEGSRVLKAKGSGGEAGSVKWVNITGKPIWIGDTKPTYNWSEIQGEKPFYTKDESDGKYVTIDTEQEITALKHFTTGLSVGESKKKIYEENGVVYIDADVAVTGAMTFYASAGRSVSTIMDGVTVDEETITKGSDNVLRIKNAGAGSSFDENAMWSALSGSSDNQINKSHLTMALEGYATRNWVIENYATKSELSAVSNKLNDFLEGSDTDNIINKWKELEAFLSGMAETDNLAEILETKADKKYVDSTFVTLATKQTITGEKTFSSVLNTAAIKASGEITTPSLAASDYVTIAGIKLRKLEDGALMLEGNLALTGALTMYASNGQSFDTIYDGLPIDNDTIYWQEVDGSRVLKTREGSGSSFDKSAMWTALAGSTTEQINKSHLTTALTGYATESWVSEKNYAVKATTLAGYGITDAPTKTGSGASGTWSIDISGKASNAGKLDGYYETDFFRARDYISYSILENFVSRKSGTYNVGYGGYSGLLTVFYFGAGSTSAMEILAPYYDPSRGLQLRYAVDNNRFTSWRSFAFEDGNIASATKLQTTRKLWGRPFDGTDDVIGDMTINGNISSVGYINGGFRVDYGDDKVGLRWAGVHQVEFGGNTGFAHTTYFFHPSYSSSGSTLATIVIENASASNTPTFTTTHSFNASGVGYHKYGLGVGREAPNDGYAGGIYAGTILANNWFRSEGSTGWLNQTYGGGWYMSDANFIRTLGEKSVYLGNGSYRNAGGEYAANNTNNASEVFSCRFMSESIAGIPAGNIRNILGWYDSAASGWTTSYIIGSKRNYNNDWGEMTFGVYRYEGSNRSMRMFMTLDGAGQKLYIEGNILATGGSSFYGSDIRYKSIIHPVMLLALNKIAEAPSFVYRWNRPNMNQSRLNLGGSAQYTQLILPWAVEENDNFLSMDYATVAYTFAVHTARHLLTYESRTDKKIKKLEREIKILKRELKKLGYEEASIVGDSGV